MSRTAPANQRLGTLNDILAGTIGRFGTAWMRIARRSAGAGTGFVVGCTSEERAALREVWVGTNIRPCGNADGPEGEQCKARSSPEIRKPSHIIVLIHGAARRDGRKVPVGRYFWLVSTSWLPAGRRGLFPRRDAEELWRTLLESKEASFNGE